MTNLNNIEQLIINYLNGNISKNDYHLLKNWVVESDEHQLIFDQMREIWLVAKMSDKDFVFDCKKAFAEFKKKVNAKSLKTKYKTISISYQWVAAVALIFIVSGFLLYHLGTVQPMEEVFAYQEIVVPYGARSNVKLPDGSIVVLNAGTTLRYNTGFAKNNRNLWLDGEGYFDVHKSETPFIVHSGTVQIKALGTAFNVRAYSSEKKIETTLVEGKLVINDQDDENKSKNEIVLLPNQKLIITDKFDTVQSAVMTGNNIAKETNLKHSKEKIKQDKIDPLPDISWKNNEWVIYRETLADLSKRMERRYDINVIFQDKQLMSFRYTGTLRNESLEQVLNAMTLVSPIRYKVEGKMVVFLENPRFNKKNDSK